MADRAPGSAAVPTLGKITRANGVAGQISYSVAVSYPDEPVRVVSFVGSTYGGPVVMVTGAGAENQTFVTEPDRFGAFSPEWVRRFFAAAALRL